MVSSAERQTPLARYGKTRKSATLTMALCLGLAWLLLGAAGLLDSARLFIVKTAPPPEGQSE